MGWFGKEQKSEEELRAEFEKMIDLRNVADQIMVSRGYKIQELGKDVYLQLQEDMMDSLKDIAFRLALPELRETGRFNSTRLSLNVKKEFLGG